MSFHPHSLIGEIELRGAESSQERLFLAIQCEWLITMIRVRGSQGSQSQILLAWMFLWGELV